MASSTGTEAVRVDPVCGQHEVPCLFIRFLELGLRSLDSPDTSDVSPVYAGTCRLLDWKQGGRHGMTVDLCLATPGPDGAHPFRLVMTGKEYGQKFLIDVAFPPHKDAEAGQCVYRGEALAMRWSENDRTGMMVRLLLDDGPDGAAGSHPFFGLAIGPRTGEPLVFKAVAVGSDESLVKPSSLRRKVPFSQLTEVAQSNILGRDPRFQRFLAHSLADLVPEEAVRTALANMADKPEAFAAAVIRTVLRVPTRSVMNGNGREAEKAKVAWRQLMADYHDQLWGRPQIGTRVTPELPEMAS